MLSYLHYDSNVLSRKLHLSYPGMINVLRLFSGVLENEWKKRREQIHSEAALNSLLLPLYSFCVIKSQPRYKLLYTQKYFNLMPSYLFVFIILNCFLSLCLLCRCLRRHSCPRPVYNFLLCYPRKFHDL